MFGSLPMPGRPPTISRTLGKLCAGPGTRPGDSPISSRAVGIGATIFRKIRKFRTRFGAHPDEYSFPWIKLDLKRSWGDDLSRRLRPLPDPS